MIAKPRENNRWFGIGRQKKLRRHWNWIKSMDTFGHKAELIITNQKTLCIYIYISENFYICNIHICKTWNRVYPPKRIEIVRPKHPIQPSSLQSLLTSLGAMRSAHRKRNVARNEARSMGRDRLGPAESRRVAPDLKGICMDFNPLAWTPRIADASWVIMHVNAVSLKVYEKRFWTPVILYSTLPHNPCLHT